MKKVLLVMSAAFILYACGGGDKPSTEEKKEPEAAKPAATETASSEKALELIGSKGCTACHAIDKKLIGPAYNDVAKKYEASPAIIDTLANKVIKGGVGVWGEVPMTANNVTLDEAKEMVTYILSLKNQ
jgi:cytochrome c